MPNLDKSRMIKDYNQKIRTLLNSNIKRCVSTNGFASNNKEYIMDYLNRDHPQLIEHLEYTLKDHFIFMAEVRDELLVFSLVFPEKFNNYFDLKSNTSIYIQFQSKYPEYRTNHNKKRKASGIMNYNEFEERFNHYSYINNLFKKHKIFDLNKSAPLSQRLGVFENLFFNDLKETSDFIENIKSTESYIEEYFKLKGFFVEKRTEKNKNEKLNKQRKKSLNQQKIKTNDKRIQELKKEIRQLEEENRNLNNTPILDHEVKEVFQNAKYEMELALENLKNKKLKEVHYDEFLETYKLIFNV